MTPCFSCAQAYPPQLAQCPHCGAENPGADCISCGLLLAPELKVCPGCGAAQEAAQPLAGAARCARHAGTAAVSACQRCGAFTCVTCQAVDSGVCVSCIASAQAGARGLLRSMEIKLGLLAIAQGLSGVIFAALSCDETMLLIFGLVGVLAVLGGTLTLALRSLWILGPIASGFGALFSLLSMTAMPPLLVLIPLELCQVWLIRRLSAAERTLWTAAREEYEKRAVRGTAGR